MYKNKIIFMGTPLIATEYLNSLINNKIKIETVLTQPPRKQSRGMKLIKSPVHLLANKKNIPVLHPEKIDHNIINKLKKFHPDLIIVMAYGKILPKELLELPQKGCINIHVSFLPRWRGAAPIEHALMNGDKETGISIIKMVEKLDAGPIIVQKKCNIPNNLDKNELIKNLNEIGTKLLIDVIPKILNDQIRLIDQNETNVTYANKITPEDRKINFNKPASKIINLIRAFSPKPGAWFKLNNERIKIFEAKQGTSRGKVSTIINNKFEIACSDGCIEPLVLQREGKKIVKKDDFLRGFELNINQKINA